MLVVPTVWKQLHFDNVGLPVLEGLVPLINLDVEFLWYHEWIPLCFEAHNHDQLGLVNSVWIWEQVGLFFSQKFHVQGIASAGDRDVGKRSPQPLKMDFDCCTKLFLWKV